MWFNVQAKAAGKMTSVNHLPRNDKDTDLENRQETNLGAEAQGCLVNPVKDRLPS